MKVFKFGGASVKSAQAVRNTASIIKSFTDTPLLVVVSAMGKTTNALERITSAFVRGNSIDDELKQIRDYHASIVEALFTDTQPLLNKIDGVLKTITFLNSNEAEDIIYDQIVSQGEIISTLIVHAFLQTVGISAKWIDAREFIFTDNLYREGRIDWAKTEAAVRTLQFDKPIVCITQGFIGSSDEGRTTTLGREGSDFSAAIFASCLKAESVTIWKDVPGVMSADPRRLPNAIVFEELPFKEAAEMTYYGASVIHPKTIKPLANAGIPLLVKNFDNPELSGTRIHECRIDKLTPLIIFKENQCLISCKVVDYTFVDEEQLGVIFKALSELDVKINLMQNSAISFSFCVDFRESKVLALIKKLQHSFEVYYNTALTLITIKNYDQTSFDNYRKHPNIILEQSSRSTLQVLVKV